MPLGVKALADTNFVVALLDANDSLHQTASVLLQFLKAGSTQIGYTDLVINEVIVVVSRRVRAQRRENQFEAMLTKIEQQYPAADLLWAYSGIEEKRPSLIEIVRKSGGKLNLHDALLGRTAELLQITYIISFDARLDSLTFVKRISRSEDIPPIDEDSPEC